MKGEMSEQKYLISRIFKYFAWSLILSVSVITLDVYVLAEKKSHNLLVHFNFINSSHIGYKASRLWWSLVSDFFLFLKSAGKKETLIKTGIEIMSAYLEKCQILENVGARDMSLVLHVPLAGIVSHGHF